MSADTYDKFREHREEFLSEFRNDDEAVINSVLNDLPENQVEKDENNEERRRILWEGCPIRMTAGYYASNKTQGQEMPIPEIQELRKLVDAKIKEETQG